MLKCLKLLCFLCLLATELSSAAYYDTLPKGVRTLVFRHVETSDIDSNYDQKQSLSPYSFNIEIDAEMLSRIDAVTPTLNQLSAIDPSILDKLLIGKYNINARAKVEVEALALGWGITSRLSAYGIVPFYEATVAIEYNRTASNNYSEVANDLQDQNNSVGQTAAQVFDQLPDFGAAHLQYVLTNELKYEDIGTWNGSDVGDGELGLIYNLNKNDKWGTAITAGVIVPTGREDDPNLLQDIGFGDGQWDIFAEFGGGYHIGTNLIINSFFRYTYQLPGDRLMRVPKSEEETLSSESDIFNEKLGNIFTYNINSEFMVNDWVSVLTAYEYHSKDLNSYDSNHYEANSILASNTDYIKHNFRLNLEVSSVKLFQNKEFLLPGKISFGYQNTFSGTNTPKVRQYEIEFRMFF